VVIIQKITPTMTSTPKTTRSTHLIAVSPGYPFTAGILDGCSAPRRSGPQKQSAPIREALNAVVSPD
jgi:hypothetical protein